MTFLSSIQPALKSISRFVATGFFSGLCPVAPGTAGSFAYLLIWLSLFGFSETCLKWFEALTVLLVIIVGTFCTSSYLSHSAGSNAKKPHDPSEIVVDEFAGMAISLLAVPCGQPVLSLLSLTFFRIFDIWKPGPVREAEKIKGASGIMLDDIVAGIFSFVLVKVCVIFFF